MYQKFKNRIISVLFPVMISMTTFNVAVHANNTNLSDEQLHAVMGIITNLILSDDLSQKLEISGTLKKVSHIHEYYGFKPLVKNPSANVLTFSIENKPGWAEFNSTTGLLSGIPNDNGLYKNILISVSNGYKTVSLEAFDVKVDSAENIAYLYGKAVQGSTYKDDETSYGALKAIDNNFTTINHTKCDNPDNDWWQLELPKLIQIASIVIHNRVGQQARLNGVKVYLSDSNYTGTVNESNLIKTLDSSMEQSKIFEPKKQGQYLLIKSTTCLHTPEVQVYGTSPTTPVFNRESYYANIHRWYNKIETVLQVNAVDYQHDVLTYSILNDVPFTIDSQGNIHVDSILTENQYVFTVKIDDGLTSATVPVTIDINNAAKANQHIRVTDATPLLTGYLPNTYKDGDSVTITIDGNSYIPTINSDGTWSIADDVISPRLAIGEYDVSIVINNEVAIIYANFFEIYGASEFSQMISLTPSYLIETIDVTVVLSTSAPLVRGKKVRASSMWLKQEIGKTIFVNESYRKMKSVIATYKDNNGNTAFKKLLFDQAIEPYSTTELTAFTDADKMHLFKTAGQFDKEISFAAESRVCTEAMADTRKECSPTNRNETPYSDTAVQNPVLSEQQVFTQVEATWHHLYNRVDGLKSIDAWINREVYKGMDFTTDYQSSDSFAQGVGKTEFFTKNFFAAFLPNNTTDYYVMRYHYYSMGLAGKPGITSFEGLWTQGAWASLWDGATKLGKEARNIYDPTIVFRLSPFEYIHHEEMHSNGMGHETGLTYGWPHQATKIFIKKYYTPTNINDADSAIFPEVEAPKYIFTTEPLSANSVKLTVYKINGANAQDLTFEVFSGKGGRADDFSFEAIDENSVKLSFDKSIFPRFFVRVYADDSDELMSKLITPILMKKPIKTIINDVENAKRYYFFPHQDWKRVAELLGKTVHKNTSLSACRILTNNFYTENIYTVDAQRLQSNFRTELNAIVGSKRFYGLRGASWEHFVHDFSNENYSADWLPNSGNTITDVGIGLMCVTSL